MESKMDPWWSFILSWYCKEAENSFLFLLQNRCNRESQARIGYVQGRVMDLGQLRFHISINCLKKTLYDGT